MRDVLADTWAEAGAASARVREVLLYATHLAGRYSAHSRLVMNMSRAISPRDVLLFFLILRKRLPVLYSLETEVFVECR